MQTPIIKPYIRTILIILACGGLLLTIGPPFLNWQGIADPGLVNNLMITGTVLWFAAAIFLARTGKS